MSDQVKIAPLEFIGWHTSRRLLGEIHYVPPALYEEMFCLEAEEEIKG
jgi:hypothetical protein